jgi:hypothetical protein
MESATFHGKHGTITVARDFAVQLLDVAADLSHVAGSLSDLIELLGPYIEVECFCLEQLEWHPLGVDNSEVD